MLGSQHINHQICLKVLEMMFFLSRKILFCKVKFHIPVYYGSFGISILLYIYEELYLLRSV